MTMHDLGTIVQENLPIKIALSNNGCQEWYASKGLFYDKRYESTRLVNPTSSSSSKPTGSQRGGQPTALKPEQRSPRRAHDGPTFIDFQVVDVGEEGNVYPMVPSGAALHEMIRRSHPDTNTD